MEKPILYFMKPLIGIVGAGMVGSQAAFLLALRGLGDIALVDINGGLAKGKALDILHALPFANAAVPITGGSDFSLLKNADIVIITAGIARAAREMKREDLLEVNAPIVADVARRVAQVAPKSILLIVTNPVDAMSWVALRASGFARERVLGIGASLDGARFRALLAQEAGVPVTEADALVIGNHGKTMVPCLGRATIHGRPASIVLGAQRLHEIAERVKQSGAQITALTAWSSFFGPAAAIGEAAEAVLRDAKKTIPCSVQLMGEYGVTDGFAGVPVVVGRAGAERIVEIPLEHEERQQFATAAEHVHAMIERCRELLARRGDQQGAHHG